MSVNLRLRKLARVLKTGSPQTSAYCTYQSFLQQSSVNYPQAYFNLTIDLELAWSRARRGEGSTSPAESRKRSRLAREAFLTLLSLSEQYTIPITFAVVGHVAVRSCADHESPPPFRPRWLPEDWYKLDPHTDWTSNQDYYGPDLVTKIKASPVGHEIASHGFSHVDLADPETTSAVAQFEINESYRLLKKIDPDLATYVFPNNHPAFLPLIRRSGFRVIRVNNHQPLMRNSADLVEFPLGLWLSPQAHSPDDLLLLLGLVSEKKQLINFWLHLYEFDSAEACYRYLQPVFVYIHDCQTKGVMKALTMREIAKVLP